MKPTDYPIFIIYSEDEEAWLARVDQLPGLVVDGATPEQALSNAKTAIIEWIETTHELGRKVPKPLSEEQLLQLQAKLIGQQNKLLQQALQQAVASVQKQQKGALITPPGVLDYNLTAMRAGATFLSGEELAKA